MIIKNLDSLKEYFNENVKEPVFGVGVHAFDRLGLEEIISDYRIIALRHSLDAKLIEKDVEVLSLEKGMGTKHIRESRNATTVLRSEKTKRYLNQFTSPALDVYKPSTKMEQICQKNNWHLLANPTTFGKKLFENKVNFRRILQDINVPVPLGRIAKLETLKYGHLMNKHGLPFVIQHPTKGSGKGTYFIQNEEEFDAVISRLNRRKEITEEWKEKTITPPNEVIVSQFIKGPSPSLTGCVTKHGILSTNLQHQVLDIPELVNPEGSIMFCGHDWTSSRFSENISHQAYEIVEKVGQRLQAEDYKGIFGLDFIMDQRAEKLYVTECNPRHVGSFPTLFMSQLLNKETPILAFHVLEFLRANYEIDKQAINNLMRKEKTGAQMFLHNLSGKWGRIHNQLKAGVYRLENEKLKYLRPGYKLQHLKNDDEFILTDGVSVKKSHFSPNRRLCRILTLHSVLDQTYKALDPWAKKTVEIIYQSFNLKRIRFVKLKKFFSPNLLAKG